MTIELSVSIFKNCFDPSFCVRIPDPTAVIPDPGALIPYPAPLIPDPTHLVTTLSLATIFLHSTDRYLDFTRLLDFNDFGLKV